MVPLKRGSDARRWNLRILALFLSVAALAAAKDFEKDGVIYDEYDEGMDVADADDQSPKEVEGHARERRQAAAPFSWMGAPFLHATCRLQPNTGSTVQGYLYLFQKRPWDYVRVKGSMWGMVERKERFDVGIYANPADGNCQDAGDTLQGATGYYGGLGVVKAKGYGKATGISRGNRLVTLEKDQPNSIIGRSVVVTSLASNQRVACCTIVEQ
ncbi:hypothetical protein J437_LFUL013424 [Ladona fulva]|uniref:Superoxide dismutase n=1 Tax=Ladona fulva TaxID=123851 RepID=A0A8K0KGT7_LADFU|nr:hypothetical protein J437_LFUL013424 [Ladona fulva]